jgi:hypothetical protein
MDFARRVIDLMLFRCGPQDLPGDQGTLVASGAVYCILLLVQVALLASLQIAVAQALLATVLLGLYVAALLRMRGLSNRFNQTATALFASGAVLTVIMLVPTIELRPFVEALSQSSEPSKVPPPSLFFALVYIVVGLWALAIYSHIYRHALNIPIALGVITTIGYEILLMVVFTLLG